jgi:flagellar biosynthesis chaperone FliJ
MTTYNTLENRLIEKLKKLSIEQVQQVEHFIDTLNPENPSQQLTFVASQLSESIFAQIWDNPEDAEYDNL